MTDCKSIEDKIIAGERLSDAEELHLLSCKACQDFSEINYRVSGRQQPSRETDDAVLTVCRSALRQNRRRRFWRLAISAAACLALLFALPAALVNRNSSDNGWSLTNAEQLFFAWDMDYDDLTDIELAIDSLSIPPAGTVASSAAANINSAISLNYEILSLEMDLAGH